MTDRSNVNLEVNGSNGPSQPEYGVPLSLGLPSSMAVFAMGAECTKQGPVQELLPP